MLRTLFCATVALGLLAGSTLAEDTKKKGKKKKGKAINGTIVKVDKEKGILTVKVKKKKTETEDKDFTVTDKTTVTVVKGDDKTELKADKVSELLGNAAFKEGAQVTITLDEEGKAAKTIVIGGKGKKKKNK